MPRKDWFLLKHMLLSRVYGATEGLIPSKAQSAAQEMVMPRKQCIFLGQWNAGSRCVFRDRTVSF